MSRKTLYAYGRRQSINIWAKMMSFGWDGNEGLVAGAPGMGDRQMVKVCCAALYADFANSTHTGEVCTGGMHGSARGWLIDEWVVFCPVI